MTAWLRTILPARTTPLIMPASIQSWGQSGKAQTRQSLALGRSWTETYQPFNASSATGRAWMNTAIAYRRSGAAFTISHYLHLTHTGGGTGTPSVKGTQTGASLLTQGWTGTDPVMRSGDLFTIAGLSYVFHLTADAPNLAAGETTFAIDPPIFAGNAAGNGWIIAYTGVTLTAVLVDLQLPAAEADAYILGATASFREALT